MSINEIDPLLELGSPGVVTYEGEKESYGARLKEWFNTVVGDVYGRPDWGNTLSQFKHEPITQSFVQVAIEAVLFRKLRADLPAVPIQSIRASEGSAIDILNVAILIGDTIYNQEVRLGDE